MIQARLAIRAYTSLSKMVLDVFILNKKKLPTVEEGLHWLG